MRDRLGQVDRKVNILRVFAHFGNATDSHSCAGPSIFRKPYLIRFSSSGFFFGINFHQMSLGLCNFVILHLAYNITKLFYFRP